MQFFNSNFISGCIRKLDVNGYRYSLDYDHEHLHNEQLQLNISDKNYGRNIIDCDGNLCGYHSCYNNGSCLEDGNQSMYNV